MGEFYSSLAILLLILDYDFTDPLCSFPIFRIWNAWLNFPLESKLFELCSLLSMKFSLIISSRSLRISTSSVSRAIILVSKFPFVSFCSKTKFSFFGLFWADPLLVILCWFYSCLWISCWIMRESSFLWRLKMLKSSSESELCKGFFIREWYVETDC